MTDEFGNNGLVIHQPGGTYKFSPELLEVIAPGQKMSEELINKVVKAVEHCVQSGDTNPFEPFSLKGDKITVGDLGESTVKFLTDKLAIPDKI